MVSHHRNKKVSVLRLPGQGDCSVLAPVASGTVDTGERVGVDWWSIV